MSSFTIKLSPVQSFNLDRLLRGKFSAHQMLEVVALRDQGLRAALQPSLYSIAAAVAAQQHQKIVEEAQARASLKFPDDMKVWDLAKGEEVSHTEAEMARIIARLREAFILQTTPASPSMVMDQPILDRRSLFRLARDHADHPLIAEQLRELVGGAEVSRQYLLGEAERLISELAAGRGDRSLMATPIGKATQPNVVAVCRRVADENPDLGYSSETIRSWLTKGLPKTSRKSGPK